ncbi:hypothetical protein C5167_001638 [Papaver somniferum]|uniref:Uncharacterized protein n=1 Tax=Papaver somniferum TaxID=3469 RepID=A0A4Y7KYK4_PAPSO|nr:hypothetical protein C5167_001638 [Papaver somniferum]
MFNPAAPTEKIKGIQDGISIEVVDCNKNFIVCLAQFDARSENVLLVCMYGALDDIDISRQWDFLSRLSGSFGGAWCIPGVAENE